MIYSIQTDDFYEDLQNNPILWDRMDTSNLPKNHPCYIPDRKKIPGFFSDEADGETITEFISLRAKAYAYKINGKEKIKAKGIRGHVVKNHMTFEDHKRCLFYEDYDEEDGFTPFRENISIRSYNHQIFTIKSAKLTYNRQDDKRHVLEDQIHTLAHGHFDIKMNKDII